jgi:alpha-ketoglutaric semialdehyde dehydrogenase
MSTVAKSTEPILVRGEWMTSAAEQSFQGSNPSTGQANPNFYPVSNWDDCQQVLEAAAEAADQLRSIEPAKIAKFLELYAEQLETHAQQLVECAHVETALPVKPRLADVELPRTTAQLRQAAAAARNRTWAQATIDTKLGIRSCYEPIGPVGVFGPNNFPFAFNSVAGGDFAAAIAAGNPVIGKANTSHPGTTQLLAELALAALQQSELPTATVQLIYRTSHEDGARLVADPRLGAVGYTGSRHAGLVLKAAADAVGKPIYLELSSINPVVILPGALSERGDEIVNEYVTSGLMGAGQFCTNPGVILLVKGADSERFVNEVTSKYQAAVPGTLLSTSVRKSLTAAIDTITAAGAKLLCGGQAVEGKCSVSNTLLQVSAEQFLKDPAVFQTEAFGNAALVIVADDIDQLGQAIYALEGNLTGCIYSSKQGADDSAYDQLAPLLIRRVGRILNDKMPTGVAVSPAMNHGGPFPATGHPGFTAVGIPASLFRFAKLTCYDNVRAGRLPTLLQDKNPTGKTWRYIDDQWTTADVG